MFEKLSPEKKLSEGNIKPSTLKHNENKNDTSKTIYAKPPVAHSGQGGYRSSSKGYKIDYNEFNNQNAWLDKYGGDMKEILGLEMSGTFEQIEKMANEESMQNDPKGIFDINAPKDRNILENLQIDKKKKVGETISLENQQKNNVIPQTVKLSENSKTMQKIFDCDVSEIRQNK